MGIDLSNEERDDLNNILRDETADPDVVLLAELVDRIIRYIESDEEYRREQEEY